MPSSPFLIVGNWKTDTGQTFDLEHWRGRPVAIAMIYADCHMACPSTVETLRYLERKTGKDCDFLLVTLEPKSDSIEVLRALRQKDRLPKGIALLRGSETMTQQLATSLGIAFRRDGAGTAHEGAVVLLDIHGHVCGKFTGARPDLERFQKALASAR